MGFVACYDVQTAGNSPTACINHSLYGRQQVAGDVVGLYPASAAVCWNTILPIGGLQLR